MKAASLKKIEECKGKLKELFGNETIIQLCKENICPHYVIRNPITKEESIWFIQSELNEWLESNYMNHIQGNFERRYQFLFLDKDLHKPKGIIPTELSKIKTLYELPIENISTPPGVYFLYKGDQLMYIGQAAVSVANRIKDHLSDPNKDFDRVFYITCSDKDLNYIEMTLINYLQPVLNRNGKSQRPSQYKNEEYLNLIFNQ